MSKTNGNVTSRQLSNDSQLSYAATSNGDTDVASKSVVTGSSGHHFTSPYKINPDGSQNVSFPHFHSPIIPPVQSVSQLSSYHYLNLGKILEQKRKQESSFGVIQSPFLTNSFTSPMKMVQSSYKSKSTIASCSSKKRTFPEITSQISKKRSSSTLSSKESRPSCITALSQLTQTEVDVLDNDNNFVEETPVETLRFTKELQLSLDKIFEDSKTWSCSLPIKCYVCEDDTLSANDLLAASQPHFKATRISQEKPFMFFDREMFPVKGGFKGEGFKELRRHLCSTATEEGYNIAVSRTYSYKLAGRSFKKFDCVCSKYYNSQKNENLDRSNLRSILRQNDRSANRKGGKKEARNLFSSRPDKDDAHSIKCPFNFQIGISFKGFYVRPGVGCRIHCGHVKLNDTKSASKAMYMSEEERKEVRTMAKACLMRSEQRNYFFEKTKRMLSLNSFAYLSKLSCELEDLDADKNKSSSDKLISFLQEKNYNYVILTDKIDPDTNEHVLESHNFDSKRFEVKTTIFKNTCDREKSAALEHAKNLRKEYNMEDTQQLLLAVAWVVPSEERLFSLYPRLIGMDTFKKSNKEKRPLFTVTGKTSESYMFTIMRVFMPNEQQWMFQWILQEAFIKLFPSELHLEVKVVISDGDSSEYDQIDCMIAKFLLNAIRLRCVFHVFIQHWKANAPKMDSRWTASKQQWYKHIEKTVKSWFFSWSRQGIYTEMAFKVSAYLLFEWLTSKVIVENMFSRWYLIGKYL